MAVKGTQTATLKLPSEYWAMPKTTAYMWFTIDSIFLALVYSQQCN